MSNPRIFFPIAGIVLAAGLSAQQPRLIRDINQAFVSAGSAPSRFTPAGNKTYFTATTPNLGRELYVVNNTTRAVRLTRDILPGTASSDPWIGATLGNTLFFSAADTNGRELWRTDGTAAGTTLVLDIRSGGQSSDPFFFARVGTRMLFIANDGRHGAELWRTDGTANGTVLVKDLNRGVGGSYGRQYMFVNGGFAYFAANDGTTGFELWRSDGTAAGTRRVKDIATGSPDSNPAEFVNVGATIYFSAVTPLFGAELYKTDGTTAGTVLVKDIYPGRIGSGRIYGRIALGNTLLFTATTMAGRELWRSDGTAAGTTLVRDINPGINSSQIWGFVVFGGRAFFAAEAVGASGIDREIWVTDGTTTGTRKFLDLGVGYSSDPRNLIASGRTMYFFAQTGSRLTALYRTDGTVAGTVRLRSFAATPSKMVADGRGGVIFVADDGRNGREPWGSDGTGAGTRMLANIVGGRGSTQSAFPRDRAEVLGELVFSADDGVTGREPWFSDGTAAGTVRVADIRTGPLSSNPKRFTVAGATVFFQANNGLVGAELWAWRQGGVAHLVKDILPGSLGSKPHLLGALRGEAVFFAKDPAAGWELHRSDGTAAGTVVVRDIVPGRGSPQLHHTLCLGDRLLMSLDDRQNGFELWVSDGTTAGTRLVKDLNPGTAHGSPRALTRIGDRAAFVATDGRSGFELWVSDGSAAGTAMVKDIYPGPRHSRIVGLRTVGNRLFFLADDGRRGRELWTSDGTSRGTKLVKDAAVRNPRITAVVTVTAGDLYYYMFNDGTNGQELWRSDGTTAGTFMLRDLTPGALGSNVDHLTATGGRQTYFTVGKYDLWASDGTPAGTRKLVTLAVPPGNFTMANGQIFTRMLDPRLGTELFAIDLPASSLTTGTGCRTGGHAPGLTSTLPILGRTTTVQLRGAVANRRGVLLVGGRAAWPWHFGQGCSIHVDFALPTLSLGIQTDAAGRFQRRFALPNDNSLVGVRIAAQAAVAGTGSAPLGLDLSDLLLWKLGK